MARDDSPRLPFPEPVDDRVADLDAARARRLITVGEYLNIIDPTGLASERLPDRIAQIFILLPATERARDLTNAYITALIVDAARKAHRSNLDALSAIHITQAAEDATASTDAGWRAHLNTIGGLMVGTGVSFIISKLSGPPLERSSLVLLVGMLFMSLLGTYLIGRSSPGWSVASLAQLFPRWRRRVG